MPCYEVKVVRQDPYGQIPDEVVTIAPFVPTFDLAEDIAIKSILKFEEKEIIQQQTWHEQQDGSIHLGGEIHYVAIQYFEKRFGVLEFSQSIH